MIDRERTLTNLSGAYTYFVSAITVLQLVTSPGNDHCITMATSTLANQQVCHSVF